VVAMDWLTRFKDFLAEYLRSQGVSDVKYVIKAKDMNKGFNNGCDTCSYSNIKYVITYQTFDEEIKQYECYSSMAELFRS
jgi:hypothetical protein